MRLCVMFSCCLIVLLAFVYFSDAASNDKPRYSETEEVRRPKTPRNSKKSEGAKTKKRPGSPKSGLSSHKVAKAKSKGCPGQCIESSAKCSSKKVLKNKCDEGYKCCLSDQARVEKTYAKRKCQTLETCNKLVGNCEGKKKGCGSNQTTYKNSKKLKYCSNKSCVCCVDSTCPTKCTKKGGVCQSQSSLCNGNLKKGKSWCGGKTCGCCLAKGACTAKNTCKKEGGVCQPASSECDGELKKDRKYCKGKSCGCCVPKKGEVMPAGHLISQDLNFISSLFCFSILTYDFLA
ncbi:keratin-associated protein 5-3-like [Homarus americanus]|uniref:keratin-associated protein 5-3-like n=1 Tax=Homarus americanus TaxID=6706 RepID=UPI001C45A263|nr:keratin-associated protein 5-3-like [Homarus americanus]